MGGDEGVCEKRGQRVSRGGRQEAADGRRLEFSETEGQRSWLVEGALQVLRYKRRRLLIHMHEIYAFT
jgi:hypothetical protein